MTKRNMNLKCKPKPFLLKPCGKDYLWGGNRLNDDFSKNIDMVPLAESWECSTHPDGHSIVDSGEYKGNQLKDVLEKHPEYLGRHAEAKGELPIMVKFIDAKEDLSVQVHPTDEYAREHENGSLGKTEMWYVLDAKKGSKIIYGFNRSVDKNLLVDSIAEGTVDKYLQKVQIEKDDVFFIKSGTIHAIGSGSLIVEVQENSNLTYRLYDYNRADKNGNLRDLHINKALEVMNLNAEQEPKQPLRVLRYKPGYASEFLCRCKYFQVERLLVNTEMNSSIVEISTSNFSFEILLCISGCGILYNDNGEFLPFYKGNCIFVPANSEVTKIHGSAKFLKVKC